MKSIIFRALSLVLASAILLSLTSVMGRNVEYEQMLEAKLHAQEITIDGLYVDRCNLEQSLQLAETTIDTLSSPKMLAKSLITNKRLFGLDKKASKSYHFPGTVVEVKEGTDLRISESLIVALLSLPKSLPIVVTSGRRSTNPSSHHFSGQAIDIRLDDEGKRLADWLITAEGESWRKTNRIEFYIEDRYSRASTFQEFSPEYFEEYFFYNILATGPHIHLWSSVTHT